MTIDAALADAVGIAIAPVLVELREMRAAVDRLTQVQPPQMGTIRDVARVLGCHEMTVRRMCARGELAHRRVGRGLRVDLSSLRPTSDVEIARLARAARGAP